MQIALNEAGLASDSAAFVVLMQEIICDILAELNF